MREGLQHLIKWFPAGTAEGEKQILESVFVFVKEFSNILQPPKGNPRLLIGPKGIGKSAIVNFVQKILQTKEIPAVYLTPMDFDTSNMGDNNSTGDMTRIFMDVLMAAIAVKLSERSAIFESGDAATIYSEAVKSGRRAPNFVGKMGRMLSEVAKPFVKVDIFNIFQNLNQTTKEQLQKAIAGQVEERSFYIFIDDTDQIANPEKTGHLNRVWSLLLAARRLAADIPELRVVITLRSEVWLRLKSSASGQRDQTDHFESLIVNMKSDRAHVEQIVLRRLILAAGELEFFGDPFDLFFEGKGARAPFSEEFRHWQDLISVRTRTRPRDAIQFVNQMARKAIDDDKNRIDEDIFRIIMPIFSKRIADEFAQEVALECPEAAEILRTFATIYTDHGGFTMSSELAKIHFSSVMSKFGISLYGHKLRQDRESDLFELWQFFYSSGVLNARVSDNLQKDGYRHLDPTKDPMLVSKPRWNDMQAVLWEINTVYRDFLISVGNEEKRMTGLPVKRPKKRRR